MHLIDWIILAIPVLVAGTIAFYSRRYVRGVADFMAGGRNAGRFLVCAARSEQGAGAVVFVAAFQIFMVAGFTINWWSQIAIPISLFLAISGFVVYRYRQTRAMTMAQFFEMRYSRRFRIFAGGLAFFAGLVNFGIIPVVGSRFMVYFLELPSVVHVAGAEVGTHLILMGIFLTICVVVTTLGGQITVLLADCAEGMISQVFYVIIALVLIIGYFNWSDTSAMLLSRPEGQSLVNPFDSFSLKDFNIWYVLMGVAISAYATMAWQNSHAFNSSAANPHESRMGVILGRWRAFAVGVMITLLVVCAMTYAHGPEGAAVVKASMDQIKDPSVARQMEVPIALSHMLPIGIKGMLVAICLMGIIAGDGIHLHSWSSILVQDVILPLRKKPLTTVQHLRLLRLAVVGVAVFVFFFGALFPLTDYVSIWFAITEAIFTGGAGAAIIGGLYWSRGTSAGAWTGLLVGSGLSVGGILTRLYYQEVVGHEFFLNGREIGFFACVAAVLAYILVSVATCRKPHNMDKLLHRGAYAVASDAVLVEGEQVTKKPTLMHRIIGIDENFTRGDRFITIGIFVWSIFWFGVFVVGSLVYLIYPWSAKVWATYWLITAILLPLIIGIVTTLWFTWGCWHDMKAFFRRLREERVDLTDDGSVTHGETTAVISPLKVEDGKGIDGVPGRA